MEDARSALAEAELRVSRMTIRSPMDGLVLRRIKSPGDKVMMGMDDPTSAQVVHVYDPDKLQVRTDVPLAEASHIVVGQRCEVFCEVLPDKAFEGVVTRITNLADLQRNTLEIKVRIIDPDPILKPEMLSRVRFLASSDSTASNASAEDEATPEFLLPREALRDGSTVLVVRQRSGLRGRVDLVPVKVSESSEAPEGLVSVTGRLLSTDLVVLDDDELQPGAGRFLDFKTRPWPQGGRGMTLIKANNLTREYKKGGETIRPLNGLNLEVQRGDFLALMGPSGSGKTTLLNLIAGIDSPTQGELIIDGINIATLGRNKLAAWRSEHVGYIFQLYNLVPVLTAFENVELPLMLHNLSRRERRSRVNEALEQVGIADRAGHYPRQMSGGQEQRVAIARALVTNPTIVVGDEPTGDLDKKSAKAIMELLQRINREQGRTIIMVTHDPKTTDYAGRTLHLESGSLVTDAESNDELVDPPLEGAIA
ncbi:MAG: ATP-binding cassette domain-containing protein [Phycisphaerales bacterium]